MSDNQDHNTGPFLASSISVPSAEPIPVAAEGSTNMPLPSVQPQPAPFPFPGLHRCDINLAQGCYRISFQPNAGLSGLSGVAFPFRVTSFQGTMRVENTDSGTIISGDLYRFIAGPPVLNPGNPAPIGTHPVLGGAFDPNLRPPVSPIPIFPRNLYSSYLKVTAISKSPFLTPGPCNLTLTVDQFDYTQPPAGSPDGSFPSSPSRTVTLVLSPGPGTNPHFSGSWMVGGVSRGSFEMTWVSDSFRKATIETNTLTGAVAPQAIGSDFFTTAYATAGWDVRVVTGHTNIAVPAGVNPNVCWGDGDLHNLLTSVTAPSVNLDKEWRMILLVVPAQLGCGRGRMFDQVNPPRKGVVSFCNDGYPTGDSTHFGAAANQEQRNIPRAFLRSACHELGHGFNQQHQEITSFGEPGADNSIMTTTPSVAEVLFSGSETFPNDINIGFNGHVRHHLIHSPDPVVRPGGMSFGTGHSSTVPQSDIDRLFFEPAQLELAVTAGSQRLKLGEPLRLSWEMTNKSENPIPTPTDIGLSSQHTQLTVTNPNGAAKPMPSFVISTDSVTVRDLAPGRKLQASTDLFWSSKGFAFKTPGQHLIEVRVVWNDRGVSRAIKSTAEVFVDYPVSEEDNQVAAQLMHDEVGTFVALRGGASHLTRAVERIEHVLSKHPDHPAAICLRGMRGHKYYKAKA